MPQSAREVRPAQESGGDAVPVLEGLLQALVDDLPVVLDDVGRLLAGPWPGYAEFLQQQHAAVADAGRDALRRVVDTADRALQGREIENTEEIDADLAVFVEVGRAEWRTGTSLATLLSAYRAGARVGWRCIARVAVARGIPADVVARLAEAVFVLVDHLSAASARGYVEEQQQAAAELERARADLVELLLAGRPDERLIEVTAARARWALPPSVTLVVVDPEAPVAVDLTGRLPGDCLSIRWPDVRGAIVPDAAGPGRRSRLADALRGTPAVIGPSVPPFRLAAALRIAQVAARLQREAVVVAARCSSTSTSTRSLSTATRGCSTCSRSGSWNRSPGYPRRPGYGWRRRSRHGYGTWETTAPSPPSCTCTVKQSATGSASCASCSVTRWTIRPSGSAYCSSWDGSRR